MGETISEALGDDHKYIDGCYEKIKSAPDLETKTRWRNQLTWTLARHAISEELTVYPAMEKHLGQEGIELTNEDRAQHQAVPSPYSFLPKIPPPILTKPPTLGKRRPQRPAEPLPFLFKLRRPPRTPHARPASPHRARVQRRYAAAGDGPLPPGERGTGPKLSTNEDVHTYAESSECA